MNYEQFVTEDNIAPMTPEQKEPNWKYYGKKEFAHKMKGGTLVELHKCRNHNIEFYFCETAIEHDVCSGKCL